MNIESLTNNKTGVFHVKNNKRYDIGFLQIPKSELTSFENAYNYVLESFDIDMSDHADRVDKYLADRNYPKVNKFPPEEQERRLRIRNTALKNLLKSEFDYVCYKDHNTKDANQLRYTLKHFMHHTADKDADLVYNQRLSYLLKNAEQKKYDDKLKLDAVTQQEKTDFVKYFQDHVKTIEDYDLEALALKEWTDEELAEHAQEIYHLAGLFADFNDIPYDLGALGIKDQTCEDIIKKYDHYGEYFMILQTRLSTIVSPSYHLYDPEKEQGMFQEMTEGGLNSDKKYSDCMDSYITSKSTIVNSEVKAIQGIFKELGVPKDQLFIADSRQEDGKNSVDNVGHVIGNDGEITFLCDNPKYSVTFNVTTGEICKAIAQNKLSSLIEQSILVDPEPVEQPNEVIKPQQVGIFGKVADFFTNIFTGHKPRLEAYNRSMTEYNEYRTALGKYNDYIKGHEKFIAKGHENENKLSLAAALKKKEQAIRDNIRLAKLAKQINIQEIGIINNPDNSNIINNNKAAKNLIAKELTDNNHPIAEKKVPENNDINLKKIRAQRAKKIIDRFNKQNSLYTNYIKNGVTTRTNIRPFDRVAMLWIDPSGTPKAETKNRNLLKKLETPEGQAEYLKKGLNSIMNLNVKQLISTDLDELLDVAEEHWDALLLAFDPTFIFNNTKADPKVEELYRSCTSMLQEAGMVMDIIRSLTSEEYEKGTFDGMSSQQIQDYTLLHADIYMKKPKQQAPNGPKPEAKMPYIQGLIMLANKNKHYVGLEQKLKDAGFTGTTVKDLANTKFTDLDGIEQNPGQVLDGILAGKTYRGESRTPAEKEQLDNLLELPAKDKSIYNNPQPQL